MFPNLLAYQQPHADHLLNVLCKHRVALDGSDTGTGKTYCALALARAMGTVPLILTKHVLIPTWERVSKALDVPAEVVNYEKVRSKKQDYLKFRKRGRGWEVSWKDPVEMAIFDEVQECTGQTSIQGKMLVGAVQQFGYVLMASATPAESPLQMKALGYALGLHTLNHKPLPFIQWARKHGCWKPPWGGLAFTDDPGRRNEIMESLNQQIYPAYGARMRKHEIEGFPTSHFYTTPVASTPYIQKLSEELEELHQKYKSMADGHADEIGELDDMISDMMEEGGDDEYLLEQLRKQKQAARLLELMRRRQELEALKLPAFAELVEATMAEGHPIAVFLNYTESIDKFIPLLQQRNPGMKIGRYDGPSKKTREADRQAFQRNELDVMVVNSFAGDAGLDMHDPVTQVPRSTLFSPQYSGRRMKQLLGRTDRIGGGPSDQRLVYYANTHEENIALTLETKLQSIDSLNDREQTKLI